MKKITTVAVLSVFIVSLFCIQTPCFAQDMLRKLGRGVGNVATGVLEIPKSIHENLMDEGPAAAVTYGVLDGLYKSLVRMTVGVFEVATFPIPFPAEYAPIVEPEFLFSPDDCLLPGLG